MHDEIATLDRNPCPTAPAFHLGARALAFGFVAFSLTGILFITLNLSGKLIGPR
jgi:hypothetical protein